MSETSATPKSICLLRLSALGDVTHVLPIVHTIQRYWPETKVTWIIGAFERKLVGDMPGVEFISFDKKRGWRAYADLRKGLRGRSFDVLLSMQVAMRSNLINPIIRAKRKIGYDADRAKDGHGLFVKERIPKGKEQHVLDSFFSFLEVAGLSEKRYDWSVPIPDSAREFADKHLGFLGKFAIISPCSSHSLRNWSSLGYARLADYVQTSHDIRIVLSGGPSAIERQMAADIEAQVEMPVLNLVGKDTLKDFLEILRRAEFLVSPDSGPGHMANCVNTPVLGLYAASNPRRSGPYQSIRFCVNKYDEAARMVLGKGEKSVRWGKKIEAEGVMGLIELEDAAAKVDEILAAGSIDPDG